MHRIKLHVLRDKIKNMHTVNTLLIKPEKPIKQTLKKCIKFLLHHILKKYSNKTANKTAAAGSCSVYLFYWYSVAISFNSICVMSDYLSILCSNEISRCPYLVNLSPNLKKTPPQPFRHKSRKT